MKDFLQVAQKTLLILITLLGSSFSASAQNWNQIIKAGAGDRNNKASGSRSSDDAYGFAVSVYGNYAVVGAPKEDENASGKSTLKDAGAAYILHFADGSWKQVKKICPSARAAQNNFGFSVSISGSYVVVGAYTEDRTGLGLFTLDDAGAAYIFQKDQGGEDNWGEVKRITASVPGASDEFGYSVAVSGDYVVVGALLDSQDGAEANTKSQAGSAYIFKKDQGGANNWGQLKKIAASDRAVTDLFGVSVAISGDNIIVGAYLDDIINSGGTTVWDAGSAYIFNKLQGGTDNWGQVKKVTATTLVENGAFGKSVAVSGDNLIVGSEKDAGTAYIYSRNKGGANVWGAVKKLAAATPASTDNFGHSVSINGDYAIVGAPFESQNSNEENMVNRSGSAYIFKRNLGSADNWGQVKKITASYRQENDAFGSSVAIYGQNVLVGASDEDDDEAEGNALSGAGSAYVFNAASGGTDNWGFVRKMIMEDMTPGDNFGYSVSISGKYAIVGAPFEDEDRNGTNTVPDAGAAYIFYNNGSQWSQVKKITPITRWANDNFGQAVSISGKYAVVGAPQGNLNGIEDGYLENAGAAYIFNMDQGGAGNWGQVKKITPLNRNANDLFGKSVSMGENAIVVGAPLTDGGSGVHQYGSAYVFAKDQGSINGWGQVKELTAAIRLNDANFGQAVSINGNYIIIGASGDSFNSGQSVIPYTGAAYIFKKDASTGNAWGLVKKIYATAHTALDRFGYSVSISGTTAIVGAYAESENSLEAGSQRASGSAYIFKKDQGGSENWGQFKKLTASDRARDDYFGYSVSISGNWVIVGAYQDDENASGYSTMSNSGSAYIFRRDQSGSNAWGQVQKITAVNRHPNDQFGYSVGISDTYAVVGSPFDNKDGSEQNTLTGAGAAFVFHSIPASGARNSAEASGEEIEKDQVLDKKIGIYPNPVVDKLYISPEEVNEVVSVSIINTMGRVVASSAKLTEQGIITSHLSTGIYIVQIRRTDGRMEAQKVVVVR